MKHLLTVFFALTAGLAAHALEKQTIAVVPFSADQIELTIGEGFSSVGWSQKETGLMTDDLVNALSKSPYFTVVERKGLKQLEEERTFQMMTGAELKNFGSELGAQYMVLGNVELVDIQEEVKNFASSGISATEFTGRMIVGLRVVDTLTGEIIFANKITYKQRATQNAQDPIRPIAFFSELKENTARRLSEAVSSAIRPIKVVSVSGSEVFINRGEGSLVKKGTQLHIFAPGRQILDPDTGEVLGRDENFVATLEVTRVMEKMSSARVLHSTAPIYEGYICRIPGLVSENGPSPEPNVRPVPAGSAATPVNW